MKKLLSLILLVIPTIACAFNITPLCGSPKPPTIVEHVVTYYASGTFVAPATITGNATIECLGAGGGGANRTSNNVGGGGGGGGAYASLTTKLNGSNSYTYTVGAGGAQNTAGGATYWQTGTQLKAVGGYGTTANSATGAAGGLAANCIGDVKYAGGWGYTWVSGTYGAGGGSSAGSLANGNNTGATNASTYIGATAPASGWGNGGNGANGAGNGSISSGYGAGGGGAYRRTSGTRLGGAGTGGLIKITYYTTE